MRIPLLTVLAGIMIITGIMSHTAMAESGSQANLMEEANACYEKRGEDGMAEKAVDLFKKIIEEAPDHYDAHWQLARALNWVGNHTQDKDKALAVLAEGEAMGKAATEIKPDGRDGLYWHGVCMGRAAEKRGILNSLSAVDPMHKIMSRIVELNPEDGFAHHFLGVMYRKAPGWPLSIGDSKKALQQAELGVKYEPESVVVLKDYAYALEKNGKKAEAKKMFEKALTMPGKETMQPEAKEEKKEIEKHLKTMK